MSNQQFLSSSPYNYPPQPEGERVSAVCGCCRTPFLGPPRADLCAVCADPRLWVEHMPKTAAPMPFVFRAQVLRVIDGDTIVVLLDRGLHDYSERTLRIRGINAPETSGSTRAAGEASMRWLRDFLGVRNPADPPTVTVRTQKPDKYGRLVADVWTAEGRHVAAQMLQRGLAVPYLP